MKSALAYENISDKYEKYELIDGEVYMMSRPSFKHSDIAFNITNIFKKYLRGKRCQAFLEPNVKLGENDQFIPDVAIVCNPEILDDPWIKGVPDLVVEILSPSTAKNDRLKKFQKYEKYGVKEYWIVDPKNKLVEVYHLVDGKFLLDEVYHPYTKSELECLTDAEKAETESQKMIKVSLYNDFIIDVADVFEDID